MNKTALQWMIEPFRKYAVFTGRAQRAEYWWFTLFVILLSIPAAILDVLLGLDQHGNGPVRAFMSLATLVPGIAVAVRRLHDIDRTGWWLGAPSVIGVLAIISFLAVR